MRDYFPYMSAGLPSELEAVWHQALFAIPEERDQHGRRVFIFRSDNVTAVSRVTCHVSRLGQWVPSTVTSLQLFTAAFTLFELIALEERTQVAGITLVADIAGFGFKHLK